MAVPIRMPDLGTTVEECRITAWRVREGDKVVQGEVLADIETDKAIVELESVAAGVVLKLRVEEEALVQVGEVLAYVGEAGEAVPEEEQQPAASEATPVGPAPVERTGEIRVAPVVRNLAVKLGVDLGAVPGTGRGGMLTREDVQRVSKEAPVEAPPRGQAAVARAVGRSWAEKPHAYFRTVVDMSAVEALRERLAEDGKRVGYDALLLRAMATTLEEFPALKTAWEGGRPVAREGTHLAVALGRGEELFLPVIRDADRLSVEEIQAEVNELVAQIRGGKSPAARMTGGVMALSNLGMYPIESFDPIIFPEHSAILAAGRVQPEALVVEGKVEARPAMRLTLAVDHRVVNGRTAAGFLGKVKERLEAGELS